MPGALQDVLTGLIAAVISGLAVWLWQRGRRLRRRRGKAAFFGLRPGRECLIVMNRHWASPHAVARSDVYALLEVGSLADELNCPPVVRSSDELRDETGDRTEFCIGGPDSNERTAAHLASFLPGVRFSPYREVGHRVELVSGDQRFIRDPDKLEYALLAKFRPPHARHPIILICGQTAITNRAAIHYAKHHHATLRRSLGSTDTFAIVVRVTSPDVYGHTMATLDTDITATAFTPAISPS